MCFILWQVVAILQLPAKTIDILSNFSNTDAYFSKLPLNTTLWKVWKVLFYHKFYDDYTCKVVLLWFMDHDLSSGKYDRFGTTK